jgi:hypothetical protein
VLGFQEALEGVALDMEPPHGMLKIGQTPQGLYGGMP